MSIRVPLTAAGVLRTLAGKMNLADAERFVVFDLASDIKVYIKVDVGFYSGPQAFEVSVYRYDAGGTIPAYSNIPGQSRKFLVENPGSMDSVRIAINGALNYIDELSKEYSGK